MIMDVFIGVVTKNNDDEKRGRIFVRLPELANEEYPEPLEPFLPPGFFSTPEVGEQVNVLIPSDAEEGATVVEFPEFAFWTARLFDNDLPLPDAMKTNYPKRRGIFTTAGHLLIFDDEDNAKRVELTTALGHSILLQDEPASSKQIKIAHSAGSSATMSSDGNVTIRVPAGKQIFADDGSGAEALLKKSEFDAHHVVFVGHVHPGVTVGAGSTLVQAPPPPNTAVGTTAFKAK